MDYTKTPLRFECTGCGACCTGGPDYYVETNAREREAIRGFLAISADWFKRRYLVQVDTNIIGIRLTKGRCSFLGTDMRCRIYPVRPTQCRTYPWWPELVESAARWNQEAKRCEGMNRGAVVPLAVIKRSLARELKNITDKSKNP